MFIDTIRLSRCRLWFVAFIFPFRFLEGTKIGWRNLSFLTLFEFPYSLISAVRHRCQAMFLSEENHPAVGG